MGGKRGVWGGLEEARERDWGLEGVRERETGWLEEVFTGMGVDVVEGDSGVEFKDVCIWVEMEQSREVQEMCGECSYPCFFFLVTPTFFSAFCGKTLTENLLVSQYLSLRF